MNLNFSTFVVGGLLLCGSARHVSAAQNPETIYEKQLAGAQKIIVTRIEVPFVPPTKATFKAGDKQGLKFLDVKPERVGEYSLFLAPADGTPRQLLWKKIIPQYNLFGHKDDFKIYDVYWENGSMVVLSKTGDWMQAEVITPELPADKLVLHSNFILLRESSPFDSAYASPSVASATIEGSFKDNTLAVAVKAEPNQRFRFFWRGGKWMSQQTSEITDLFNKTEKINEQPWSLTLRVYPSLDKRYPNQLNSPTYVSSRLQLLKAPAKKEERDPLNGYVLWESEVKAGPGKPPANWTADVYYEDDFRKIFMALSDGSRFWLEVLDFSAPQSQKYSVEPTKTVTDGLPFIENLKITRVDDELIVSIGSDDKTKQKWAYSLKTKQWNPAP